MGVGVPQHGSMCVAPSPHRCMRAGPGSYECKDTSAYGRVELRSAFAGPSRFDEDGGEGERSGVLQPPVATGPQGPGLNSASSPCRLMRRPVPSRFPGPGQCPRVSRRRRPGRIVTASAHL